MRGRDIKIDKFTPKDLSDTPEGFEKRYADKRPRPKPKSPLAEPERPSMSNLLDRFNLGNS